MSLYIAASTLAALTWFLLGPCSVRLAQSTWVGHAPRAAVALWQSIGFSAGLATVGTGLCLATERFHAGFVGGLSDLIDGALSGHPLRGLGLPDALGLTLAADLGVVLVALAGSIMMRTVRARARHRRLLDLLATRATAPIGTVLLDHPQAVAYCLPGIRPRIVISAGTVRLLDDAELAAVISHEQGHAHERHGMVMLPMTGLSDLFHWIPYARLAPNAVAELLEMAADDHAARRHPPAALASALVSLSTSGALPSCAFGLATGGVIARVHRLLHPKRTSKGTALATGFLSGLVVAVPIAIMIAA
jgi:Zn-dependent protease with chaperone function